MKVVLLVFSFIFISEISAYTLQRIEGIDDLVEEVNFDSDGNVYASLNNFGSRHQLYKVNPSKEIQWVIDIPENFGSLVETRIPDLDEIYLDFFDITNLTFTLAKLQPGSTEIEEIEVLDTDLLFYLDNNGDLIYNREDGIYQLKPNSLVPVPIRNLEHYQLIEKEATATDQSGTAYLGVSNLIATITSKSQQEETPSAIFIDPADSITEYVEDLKFDDKSNLWVSIWDYHTGQGIIKKLNSDDLETIAVDTDLPDHKLIPAKDKVFVIAGDFLFGNGNCSIKYVDVNKELIKIPELENVQLDYWSSYGVADSDGNVYFHSTETEFSSTLGPMVVIKPDNVKPVPIVFDSEELTVDAIKLDFNEDIWIQTDSRAYYLKKGDAVPEIVNIPAGSFCGTYLNGIYVNWVTKEIYVSCVDGLYVVAKD